MTSARPPLRPGPIALLLLAAAALAVWWSWGAAAPVPTTGGTPPQEPAGAAADAPDPAPPRAPTTLEVQLHCLGAPRSRRVQFAARHGEHVAATAERRETATEYTVRLTVPAGLHVEVAATVFDPPDAAVGAFVLPARPSRGPGALAHVDLFAGEAPTTLRVAGPSPRLRVALELELAERRAPADRAAVGRWPLPAQGPLALQLPQGEWQAALRLADGVVPLRTRAGAFWFATGGDAIELLPAEPLVGVVIGEPGAESAVALGLDAHAPRVGERTVHATTAARLGEATRLRGHSAALGPFALDPARLRDDGDLRRLASADLEPLRTLSVRLAPAATTTGLELLAEPLAAAGEAIALEPRGERLAADLPAGAFRLRWRIRGGDGPVASERVEVPAGAPVDLTLAPPQLRRWRVRLCEGENARSAVLFARLHGAQALGGQRDGLFAFELAEPLRLGEAAELWFPATGTRCTGNLTGVDAGAGYAELTSVATEARWCRVRSEPLAGGRQTLRLAVARGEPPPPLPRDAVVPVLPRGERTGAVAETIDGREQLVAWFVLRGDEPEVAVTPRGRWATLHLLRPVVRARWSAVGPGAATVPGGVCEGDGDHPLWLAEGTAALVLDLEPGGRVELPADGDLVVR